MNKYFLFPIYLDYSSTNPVDPRVIEKMMPYFYYKFGNYSSRSHLLGWNSEYIIESSRKKISYSLNCDKREIIWTSGATESNNLAIKGISFFYKNKGNHLISSFIDHKSVLECFKFLNKLGYDVTFLNVKKNGLIDIKLLFFNIKYNTILITLFLVNNEIGVIQNVKGISEICKKKKIILHIDSAQSVGKIFLDLKFLNIDLLSLSSHKVYGPKGVGALYIRRKSNIYFDPLIHGGGQEKNLRSGTLSTTQIVGMSEAYLLSTYEMFFENFKLKNFKNIILLELLKIDSIYINGDLKYRIPHNLNISFNYIEGESLIISMKNISISTGSACASSDLSSSYVIRSLNKNYSISHNSIRFTLGKFLNLNMIEYFLKLIFNNIKKLRLLSPLCE